MNRYDERSQELLARVWRSELARAVAPIHPVPSAE
jgi:hypothetical protein